MRIKLIFLVALLGCNAARNNKALTRVLSNDDLSEKAYTVLVKQHPVRVDTLFKTLPGREITVYDTTYTPEYFTDTVFNQLPGKIKTISSVITKRIIKVDTLLRTVQDDRLLASSATRITVLETQLKASQESDSKHKAGKLHWIFASVGLFLLLLIGIILVLKKKV